MPDGSFKASLAGGLSRKHVLLFFYPLDFTFVCPTKSLRFPTASSNSRSGTWKCWGRRLTALHPLGVAQRAAEARWQSAQSIIRCLQIWDKSIAKSYDVLLRRHRSARPVHHRPRRHRAASTHQRFAARPKCPTKRCESSTRCNTTKCMRSMHSQLAFGSANHEGRPREEPGILRSQLCAAK